MKKTLKIFGLLLVGFTAGEFATNYRLYPDPITLGDFTKKFVKQNTVDAVKEGLSLAETYKMHPDLAKMEMKEILFPRR